MKWESNGAKLYYVLGAAYYLYHWLFIFGIGTLISTVILVGTGSPILAGVLSAVSLFLLAGGTAALVVKTKKRLDSLNPDVLITALTDTYTIVSDSEYAFTKRLTIKGLRTGVEHYKTKYRWSGSGDVQISVEPSLDYDLTLIKAKDDMWDIIRINFHRPLRKDEERSFALTIRFALTGTMPLPFFQKLIDDVYPNGITMRVELPIAPPRFVKEIFFSARSEVSAGSEIVDKPAQIHEWVILRPRVHRRYRISW